MDSVEGQLEDFWEAELLLLPEHAKYKVDEKSTSQDSSEVSDLFWVNKASEMDSTGRTLKSKCKPSPQKVNVVCNVNEDLRNLEDVDSKWQDLPMELLVRILGLVDHRTVIVACGVCTGWRDAMRFGILELSFSWCKRNTSKLVQSIAPKFTGLQVCNLRNNKLFLNDQAVEALANHCHDLRALDLSNGTLITDASLFALARGCERLERLNLSGCSRTSELGLKVLAENCSSLMHLNLCGCSNAGSDQALLALARNCIALQSLNLGWCERITDLGVTGLALWCSDLRVVDLCGCLLITDQSVIALADKCHHLRVLGLYSCLNITDAAMYALANSSKYRIAKCIPKRNRTRCNAEFVSHSAVTRSSTGSCSSSSNSSSSSSSSCSSNNDGSTVTSRDYFESLVNEQEGYGLLSLNLGMCTYLSAPAVQAVCDAFPGLHTCAERHSLNISGCLNLISVHCVCVVEAKKFVSHYASS